MAEWTKEKIDGYPTYVFRSESELGRHIPISAEIRFTPSDGELAGSITIMDIVIEGLAGYGTVYDDDVPIDYLIETVAEDYASELRYMANQLNTLAEKLSSISNNIPKNLYDEYNWFKKLD